VKRNIKKRQNGYGMSLIINNLDCYFFYRYYHDNETTIIIGTLEIECYAKPIEINK
jgi:hypothetical protein